MTLADRVTDPGQKHRHFRQGDLLLGKSLVRGQAPVPNNRSGKPRYVSDTQAYARSPFISAPDHCVPVLARGHGQAGQARANIKQLDSNSNE